MSWMRKFRLSVTEAFIGLVYAAFWVMKDLWRLSWVKKIVILAVLGFVALVVVSVGGFMYTCSSGFCKTCHIMQPYYDSWKASAHSEVKCVTCHFPESLAGQLVAKLKASSQLVSYVTGSAGTIPRAEVEDANCLREGCHSLDELDDEKVEFMGTTFSHLTHRKELLGNKNLRCTSCHTLIVQDEHFTVTTDSCFLCHFKDRESNEDRARCTLCHSVPDKTIEMEDAEIDHGRMQERNIPCSSCHARSISGNGRTSLDRCRVCHDAQALLDRFEDKGFLHIKHVTDHAVPCLSCHDRIEHSREVQFRPDSLNCATCHPDHHADTVDIFEGRGAPVESSRSSKAVLHVECTGCHTISKHEEHKRDVTAFAGSAACVACHDKGYANQLDEWKEILRESLADVKDSMKKAEGLVNALPEDNPKRPRIKGLFDEASKYLRMVVHGNGIHNVMYADEVLSLALDKFDEAIELAESAGKE